MILLMGIAGSGKGTQGKMLADQRSYHLISMGDVLRMHVTGKLRERMLAGELLNDTDIINIINKVLTSIGDDDQVLLDGFPRTIPQAEWFMEQVEAGRFDLNTAFHLVASRQAVKDRLINRGRIDDVEDSIEARFAEYARSTEPLLDWLSDHGVEVVNIKAEQSVEQVNEDITSHLDKQQ